MRNRIDYVGTYSGASWSLAANVPFDVTGEDDLAEELEPGQIIVADVDSYGDPSDASGGGCAVVIGHAVEQPNSFVGDQKVDRACVTWRTMCA